MKNNFVAKHAREYNKAKVFIDRKVASKKGYSRYKGYQEMNESCPNCGEFLSGDGYGTPERCPNALEERWWYAEPDSGPYYCSEEEE